MTPPATSPLGPPPVIAPTKPIALTTPVEESFSKLSMTTVSNDDSTQVSSPLSMIPATARTALATAPVVAVEAGPQVAGVSVGDKVPLVCLSTPATVVMSPPMSNVDLLAEMNEAGSVDHKVAGAPETAASTSVVRDYAPRPCPGPETPMEMVTPSPTATATPTSNALGFCRYVQRIPTRAPCIPSTTTTRSTKTYETARTLDVLPLRVGGQ